MERLSNNIKVSRLMYKRAYSKSGLGGKKYIKVQKGNWGGT